MSTNLVPLSEQTQSGWSQGKYPEKATNYSPNTSWKTEATTKKDIADTLAETFSANSSFNNSNPYFLTFKNSIEKQKLNFKSNNSEKYNQLFILAKLQEAIETLHNTAVGPDEIHYDFLKHLPKNSLDYLPTICNDIWINSKFPESWKIATMIPIPKPGRDDSNQANYRPIALTSCLCKTMKCMVNKRLIWFLQSNKLFTNSQCGFRKQKIYNGSHGEIGNFHKRGQHPKTIPYSYLLWSGEGLWDHLEVWNDERPA